MERLNVRTGGYDCTMYGGMCGAGMDNIFYANGKIFICGNCIDLSFSMPYDTHTTIHGTVVATSSNIQSFHRLIQERIKIR